MKILQYDARSYTLSHNFTLLHLLIVLNIVGVFIYSWNKSITLRMIKDLADIASLEVILIYLTES